MRRLAAVAVVTATVALAACGDSTSGESGPPRAPTGADEVVVRVVTEGGFTAETRRPAHLPQLSVFGGGRVVVTGPTALQYPGPALPNVQEFRVTRAGLARILETARAAGLLDDAVPDYGDPGVTDQATTTVTVRADGITRRVDVYALGFRGRVSGVTPEQSEQRDRGSSSSSSWPATPAPSATTSWPGASGVTSRPRSRCASSPPTRPTARRTAGRWATSPGPNARCTQAPTSREHSTWRAPHTKATPGSRPGPHTP